MPIHSRCPCYKFYARIFYPSKFHTLNMCTAVIFLNRYAQFILLLHNFYLKNLQLLLSVLHFYVSTYRKRDNTTSQ